MHGYFSQDLLDSGGYCLSFAQVHSPRSVSVLNNCERKKKVSNARYFVVMQLLPSRQNVMKNDQRPKEEEQKRNFWIRVKKWKCKSSTPGYQNGQRSYNINIFGPTQKKTNTPNDKSHYKALNRFYITCIFNFVFISAYLRSLLKWRQLINLIVFFSTSTHEKCSIFSSLWLLNHVFTNIQTRVGGRGNKTKKKCFCPGVRFCLS